jgi:acetate kinase
VNQDNNKSLVLVFNCGSSSIKFALLEPTSGESVFKGLVQKIGLPDADIQWQFDGKKQTQNLGNTNYTAALQVIVDKIRATDDLFTRIFAVGHRVVHGGEEFKDAANIDNEVLAAIKKCIELAPLHNPANIQGIEAAQKALPGLPQVAVFDTAFHQTMPKEAYIYPIPYELYTEHKIRRYGFHGTSHKYVSQEAARLLKKDIQECYFVTAHLGNGCSAAAIAKGESVDTTMGMTPLEGLVMGTRSGDIDPTIIEYLVNNLGYSLKDAMATLNKKSGMLGISQESSDMRTIEDKVMANDKQATLAFDIFCYRLAKYIAAYAVTLGKLDALIFTGGIGENSPMVRAKTLGMLKMLGFVLDEKSNLANGKQSNHLISAESSKHLALVIPTNEELMIARETAALAC